jgi:nucleoid-associated protein YgaU
MDGLPSYQQPRRGNWLRMLFLSTGFVIGGMCLWAFVQQQSAKNQAPAAAAPPAEAPRGRTDATSVLQVADESPSQPWQHESPARAAITAAPSWQPPATEVSAWQGEQISNARQASFEVTDAQPIHVSKPPLTESEHFIPLPDFSPLAAGSEERITPSHEAHVGSPAAGNQPPAGGLAPAAAAEPDKAMPVQVPRADSIITVANDSFWQIAQRVYGDPRYYAALFEHNRNWIAYPDQIEQGFRVMTPPVDELRARYAELCPDVSNR